MNNLRWQIGKTLYVSWHATQESSDWVVVLRVFDESSTYSESTGRQLVVCTLMQIVISSCAADTANWKVPYFDYF